MKNLTPNLMVEDVDKSIEFYRDVLGFEELMTKPNEETGITEWGMIQAKHGDVKIMFQKKESLTSEIPYFQGKEPGGSLTLYIDLEDARELYDVIRDKVRIIDDWHDTFYHTKEFSILDNNGYVLTFAEQAHKDE